MIGRKEEYQSKREFIDLNIFVPSHHLLRQINEKIEKEFEEKRNRQKEKGTKIKRSIYRDNLRRKNASSTDIENDELQ